MRSVYVVAGLLLAITVISCSDKGATPDNANVLGPKGKLYVMNQSDDSIYIFDTQTMNKLAAVYSQVSKPHYISFAPDSQNYYIMTVAQVARVAKFSSSDNSFLGFANLPPSVTPSGMAITPDSRFGYVCDYTAGATLGSIYKIDLQTMSVVASYQSGANCHELKMTYDGEIVVACNRNSDKLTLIYTDGDSVVLLPVDSDHPVLDGHPYHGPYCIDIAHGSYFAYITCFYSNQVKKLNLVTREFVDSFFVPVTPNPSYQVGCAMTHVSHDRSRIYLTTYWGNTAVCLDANSGQILREFHLGTPAAFGIALSEDDSKAYVATVNYPNENGMIYVIDTQSLTVTDSVTVGHNSYGIGWFEN